jgi:hypothetical protein
MVRSRRLLIVLAAPFLLVTLMTPAALAVPFKVCLRATTTTTIWAYGQIGVQSVGTAHTGDLWWPSWSNVQQGGVSYNLGNLDDNWSVRGMIARSDTEPTTLVCA